MGSATLAGGFTIDAAPPSLSLRFEGKLRDRVGKGNTAVAADGQLDATFKVTIETGSGPRTVTQLELWTLNGSGRWDTIPATPNGSSAPPQDSTAPSTTPATPPSTSPPATAKAYLFTADLTPSVFTPGVQVRVLARLADGSSTTADTTIP